MSAFLQPMIETTPVKAQTKLAAEAPVRQALMLSELFRHYKEDEECRTMPSQKTQGTEVTRGLLEELARDAAIVGDPDDQTPGCRPYVHGHASIEKIFK